MSKIERVFFRYIIPAIIPITVLLWGALLAKVIWNM